MASSRRRFLTTMGAAAAGAGVAGSARGAIPGGAHPGSELPRDAFSPAELLERHARQSAAAATPAAGTAPAAAQSDPPMPSQAEVESWYRDLRNWGRWGDNDQKGAVNLITPEKSAAAAGLVRNGRKVSMSRVFEPAQHFIRKSPRPNGAGACVDYLGFIYHGQTVTHIDALCHMWDVDGMWQGRDPDTGVTTQGAAWGAIDAWSDGIVTKGVLLDVPRHRGEPHVTPDRPVHGWELEEIAEAEGVTVEAGDALLVYSGKDPYVRAGGEYGGGDRPGLSATCAKFVRDHDVALLGWDMMDARPDPYNLAFPMHGVLFNFGVALLDNALLEPLAAACAEEGRYEFMFMGLPLNVARGTGSPANPIAMF
ncbi:MAG: cyclase family protein [Acidobacteria bacterium]|nr:cyclase family protein [Acidobacteriota bacterium]